MSRREALTLLGGVAVLGACGRTPDDPGAASSPSSPSSPSASASASGSPSAAPSTAAGAKVTVASFGDAGTCALTPEQTEGPYYIDVDKIRADIREDREGTPLRVAVRVLAADGCTPVGNAVFEIWHCDAGGLYSGFEQASRGGGSGQRDETRYLRGAQVTDADGIAVITTIYPGWYRGRTVHIHAKIAVSNTVVLTTQLYFDDELSTEVYQSAPYTAHGQRDTFNTNDSIFRSESTLTVRRDGDGYLGLLTIGVAGAAGD